MKEKSKRLNGLWMWMQVAILLLLTFSQSFGRQDLPQTLSNDVGQMIILSQRETPGPKEKKVSALMDSARVEAKPRSSLSANSILRLLRGVSLYALRLRGAELSNWSDYTFFHPIMRQVLRIEGIIYKDLWLFARNNNSVKGQNAAG